MKKNETKEEDGGRSKTSDSALFAEFDGVSLELDLARRSTPLRASDDRLIGADVGRPGSNRRPTALATRTMATSSPSHRRLCVWSGDGLRHYADVDHLLADLAEVSVSSFFVLILE